MLEKSNHHIEVEFAEPRVESIEVEPAERFHIPEQAERDQATGAHILAAMEKQFGPIDEAITERANRVTVGNDEYERV